jgi:hypothetical protein
MLSGNPPLLAGLVGELPAAGGHAWKTPAIAPRARLAARRAVK